MDVIIMEQKIYQNGFYVLIGLIIGFIVGFTAVKPSVKPMPVNIEIRKDSIEKADTSKKVSKCIPMRLNESNLRKECIRQGLVHTNIVVAQAKLESQMGKSDVYKKTNNLFGLRKGKKYRKFSHWTESVSAYKDLIQSRYNGGSYLAFLNDIGYAEDPLYTERLKELL